MRDINISVLQEKFISGLIESDAKGKLEALNAQVQNMKNPTVTMAQVLYNLEDNGLKRSVSKLRDLLK